MRPWIELFVVLASILVIGLLVLAYIKIPRRLKKKNYVGDWKYLQNFCKDKNTWPKAISDADKLLDQALKSRKFKGKSMGERLVSANKKISDNESVWTAHKLAKRIIADPALKLRASAVKTALVSYRQALKDLGALPDGK